MRPSCGGFVRDLDEAGIHRAVAQGDGRDGDVRVAQVKAVDGDGVVDVIQGVHDFLALHRNGLYGAVRLRFVGHALFADLQEHAVLKRADPVQVHQRRDGLVVGGGEEHLAVDGVGHELTVYARVVEEAVHRDVRRILAHVALNVGLNAVLAVAVGIIPVVDESAHIAGLHQVVLGAVAGAVEREVLPHEALVVPLVEDADTLFIVGVEQVAIVKPAHVQLAVGRGVGHEGHGQQVVAPADVVAGGVRDHLVGVGAQQQLGVILEGDKHRFELSRVVRGGVPCPAS